MVVLIVLVLVLVLILVLFLVLTVFVLVVLVGGVLVALLVLVVLFLILVGNPKKKCVYGCPDCSSLCSSPSLYPIPCLDCFCLGCPTPCPAYPGW